MSTRMCDCQGGLLCLDRNSQRESSVPFRSSSPSSRTAVDVIPRPSPRLPEQVQSFSQAHHPLYTLHDRPSPRQACTFNNHGAFKCLIFPSPDLMCSKVVFFHAGDERERGIPFVVQPFVVKYLLCHAKTRNARICLLTQW